MVAGRELRLLQHHLDLGLPAPGRDGLHQLASSQQPQQSDRGLPGPVGLQLSRLANPPLLWSRGRISRPPTFL